MSGCLSSTEIKTDRNGARLLLDGSFFGRDANVPDYGDGASLLIHQNHPVTHLNGWVCALPTVPQRCWPKKILRLMEGHRDKQRCDGVRQFQRMKVVWQLDRIICVCVGGWVVRNAQNTGSSQRRPVELALMTSLLPTSGGFTGGFWAEDEWDEAGLWEEGFGSGGIFALNAHHSYNLKCHHYSPVLYLMFCQYSTSQNHADCSAVSHV